MGEGTLARPTRSTCDHHEACGTAGRQGGDLAEIEIEGQQNPRLPSWISIAGVPLARIIHEPFAAGGFSEL
jgi:hypothetical protein